MMAVFNVTVVDNTIAVQVGEITLATANNATAAANSATAAAASAAAVGVGGRFGSIPTKTSDADAAIAWRSRGTFGDVPTSIAEIDDAANRQILITSFTNPSTRVTASTVSNKLRLQSNLAAIFLGTAGVGFRAFDGRTVTGAGRIITLSGAISNVGFGIVLTPTQPTLNGATAVLDESAVFLGLRSNGTVVALGRDGTTAATGVTITGNTSTPWAQAQTNGWKWEPTSATAGSLSFFADGVLLQTCTVSGVPSEAWVATAVRFSGLDLVEFENPVFTEESFPVARSAYLDPNNGGDAIGTEANPFVTLEQALESLEVDSARREVSVVLKAGIYRGTLPFNADRWNKVTVRGVKGQGAIIRPSFALSGAVWASVSGEVWKTANRWVNVSGSVAGIAGLFETGAGVSQAFGRTGLVTVAGRALYTRAANNTAAGSLQRGQYSLITTGGDAGQIYARAYDGGDPNDKTWEQPQQHFGVSCVGSANSGWNKCVFTVTDLVVEYAHTYGIFGKWVNGICENVAVKATASAAGFGFEFDESNFQAYGCLAEGVSADGFHSAGGLSSDSNRRLPVHHYWDCDALGVFGSGDGFSNHPGHVYHVHNCRAWSSGKDGISAIQQFSATDFDTRDHVDSGIKLALGAGETVPLSTVNRGVSIGNNIGVALIYGANNDVSGSLDVNGTWIEGNVSSSLRTFASGTNVSGAINARGVQVAGATPSNGHIHTGVLPINVIAGEVLA